jgi:hypothetical protein
MSVKRERERERERGVRESESGEMDMRDARARLDRTSSVSVEGMLLSLFRRRAWLCSFTTRITASERTSASDASSETACRGRRSVVRRQRTVRHKRTVVFVCRASLTVTHTL